jgi:hypothetical protein
LIDRIETPKEFFKWNHSQTRNVVAMPKIEALCRKITEEDPGYFDRLADRIIAEAESERAAFR